MGDAVADYKSTVREKELTLLYKLVFDTDLTEASPFKFIKDLVSHYEGVDDEYRTVATEEGQTAVSLEDVLLSLEAEKEKRELNSEEKTELVYCKSIDLLKKMLESELENEFDLNQRLVQLDEIKKYLIDSHPKIAVEVENCYRVAKAYLHEDDRFHCFDVLFAYLDAFWKDKNSFKKSPGKDLFSKIIKYGKELEIKQEIYNRIIDLGIKKGIIKYQPEEN